MIKVKNLRGTDDSPVPSGYKSWIDYWKKKTGRNYPDCAVYGHHHKADVGAHVQKADSSDNRWYIVPVCYSINNQHGASFYVSAEDLVLENDD
jgi:hypothetical protein